MMAHGHGDSHAVEHKFDVIPEGSAQDKLLVFTAMLALVLLLFFAWSMLSSPLLGTAG